MIRSSPYFLYSVAQYVHPRREERLNVGVVIIDPSSGKLTAHFDAENATRRIKSLYPEVERKGLELYLKSLGSSLQRHPLPAEEPFGDALDTLAAGWQNILRLTPTRPIPAPSASAAVERLQSIYLTVEASKATRPLRGVARARQRTLEAIQTVLGLDIPGLGYRTDYTFGVPYEWQGKRYEIKRHFAFLLQERFAVDTVSLESSGMRETEKEAAALIAKAKDVRKLSGGHILPHATVSIDPEREEHGRSLIAYIMDRGEFEEDQVVEASDAEKMMIRIRGAHAA